MVYHSAAHVTVVILALGITPFNFPAVGNTLGLHFRLEKLQPKLTNLYPALTASPTYSFPSAALHSPLLVSLHEKTDFQCRK